MQSNGELFFLSDGLTEAIAMALAAAHGPMDWSTPPSGERSCHGAMTGTSPHWPPRAISHRPSPAPGCRSMNLDGRLLHRTPGIVLDLGATAKGLGSDRAVQSAIRAIGHAGGVLVSLGGDVAIAGQAPAGGWPILVAEDPSSVDSSSTQVVRLRHGALATSSVTCRRWSLAGREVHHIIDPRTGAPAQSKWRTATVAAPSCVTANAASTALIVGGEEAEAVAADDGTCGPNGWPRRIRPSPGIVAIARRRRA